MSKLAKTALSSFLLLALGAGLAVLFLRPGGTLSTLEEGGDLAPQLRAMAFDPAEVVQIDLQSGGETLQIELKSGAPMITQPVQTPASRLRISELLSALSKPPLLREIPASADERKKLGLVPPAASLKLRFKDQSERTVLLGQPNPLTDAVALQTEAEGPVFLLPQTTAKLLTRGLSAMRSSRLIPISSDTVKGIQLYHQGGLLADLVLEQASWRVRRDDGPNAPARQGKIAVLLALLTQRLTVTEVKTDAYKDAMSAKYGLDSPETMIELDLKSGARLSYQISAGDAQGQAFAWQVDSQSVFLIEAQRVDELVKLAPELEDRRVRPFEPAEVRQVLLDTAGQGELRIDRQGEEPNDSWTLSGPETGKARVWRVKELLNTLAKLEHSAIYVEKPTDAQLWDWNLKPWSRRIRLQDAKGKTLLDLRLGKYMSDHEIIAREGDTGPSFLVLDLSLRILPDTHAGWRD